MVADALKNNADATATSLPVADGGEGTVDAVLEALAGVRGATSARDPRGRPVTATFGWCAEQKLAIVELAAASGLTLLADEERNPLQTSTCGTGDVLRTVMQTHSPERILLGVGGSATVDGGTGAACALGWRFLNQQGHDLPPGGGALVDLHTIVPPPCPKWPVMEVLCDVTNPLVGPRGAAQVFGPQKGATPSMVVQLDEGLGRLAEVVRTQFGVDIATRSGGGAAGGFAAGATVWFSAMLVPGIERILDVTGFDQACRTADWIITGEGRLDEQSLEGKVVSGLLARARAVNPSARVAVLAGSVALPAETLRAAGIAYADALTPEGMPLAQALRDAPALLDAAARRFIETIRA